MSGLRWIQVGAILSGIAVATGAFAAHGLKSRFSAEMPHERRMLENFETASRYQMYHSLAILAVGFLLLLGRSGTLVQAAGWAFLLGTLVFSGSLYLLVLTGERRLGAITPLGGLAFLVGWTCMAIACSLGPK